MEPVNKKPTVESVTDNVVKVKVSLGVDMKVKVFLSITLDEDDYPIPVDGFVDEEIREALHEFIYDIDGMTIETIRIIAE